MTDPSEQSSDSTPPDTPAGSLMERADAWAAEHVWHPRMGVWFGYMILLAIIQLIAQPPEFLADQLPHEFLERWPVVYGPLKILQAILIIALIRRWRKLMPEITWKFHWLVIPSAVFLTFTWVWLGHRMVELFPEKYAHKPGMFEKLWEYRAIFWLATIGHLVAMMTAVPMIEEVFNRSLLLRSFHSPRQTGVGILQFLCDFPGIGDWLLTTKVGTRVSTQGPVFTEQFKSTALGELSVFAVIASTVVFCLVHSSRDWPAAFICGITWCLMLRITRHKGLGPVIWSHALTNLLLWGYVIYMQVNTDGKHGEWMFF